jgi:putative inorganic carbon (HCO3(-)) transporter
MSPQTGVSPKAIRTFPQFGGNLPPLGPQAQARAEAKGGTLVFWACAGYTFLLFSRTVEFIDSSGRLHLSLFSGLACILAALVTGTIPGMLISKPGKWISLFSFWIFIGLPFSTWKGGSITSFQNGWLKSYLTFFIVGGLIFTLAQLRTMTVIFALSTVSQIYLSYHNGANQEADRMAVTYGSLGNANDLASALLIGMPFVVFVMYDKKIGSVWRFLCLPVLVVLLVTALKTGSRGGLIGIVTLFAFSFFKSSASGKMLIMVGALVGVALFAAVVPADLRTRYMTIFKTDRTATTSQGADSALESSQARRGLIENALILTMRHPVFGVGLSQFSPQSFNLFVERGFTGMWFTCHDIFGLVASETGIPGLVFFCGTIVTCFRLLSQISKVPATTPELDLISRLSLTILMALVAFVMCGIFNTQAYSHQLPVLAALTAALNRIAAPYIAKEGAGTPVAAVATPFVNRRIRQQTVQAVQ